MARTVRDAKLESRTARSALKSSGKPYYRAIDEGLHLGYRKGERSGKWVMRRYIGDGKYSVEVIGTADDNIPDADGTEVMTFSQAQARARNMFIQARRRTVGLPAKAGPYTIKVCLEEYLTWMEQNRKSAKDARWRAEALIYPALGGVLCDTLTHTQIRDWRDAVADTPPRLRSKKGTEPKFRTVPTDATDEEKVKARRQRRASANRVLTILKAGLNHAWREHKIASDDAWRRVEPFKGVDEARVRYLEIDEDKKVDEPKCLVEAIKRLIETADSEDPKKKMWEEFLHLVLAALHTGARFGELAALRVRDFDSRRGTLFIRTSKSGKPRHVVLTEDGIAFVKGLAEGRDGDAYLLVHYNGKAWSKSQQARPMTEACEAAGLKEPIGFHGLRHTYASHAVMNGMPLLILARNLGHTDTRMVEKHYGHLSDDHVAEAVRASAPRFGLAAVIE